MGCTGLVRGYLLAPMDFQDRIDADIKDAMKAKQAMRLGVLRMLKSALKNAAIEQGGADVRLDEAAAQSVLRKEAKKRQDSIEGFQKGGRPELAEKEREELGVLSDYLPKPLSAAELDTLVSEVLAELGATSKGAMGQVMKLATEKAAGRVDGDARLPARPPRANGVIVLEREADGIHRVVAAGAGGVLAVDREALADGRRVDRLLGEGRVDPRRRREVLAEELFEHPRAPADRRRRGRVAVGRQEGRPHRR